MPSSRWQIRSTLCSSASTRKSERTRAARSVNSRTASSSTSDGTRHTSSPGTRSGSRLVASTDTSGQVRSKASTRLALASRTCSQVSRHNNICRSRSCNANACSGSADGSISARTAAAVRPATNDESDTEPRSTHHTPSRQRAPRESAVRMASRVLPHPPAPAIVISRVVDSSRSTSSSSASRPTKLVSWVGRLSGIGSPDPGGRRCSTCGVHASILPCPL